MRSRFSNITLPFPPSLSHFQGTNGLFEYLFDPQTTSPAALSIDSTTGIITLAQSIDYDTGDTEFEVTVS